MTSKYVGIGNPCLSRSPKFPKRISNDDLPGNFRMLGLGDLAIPGFLVTYCLKCDVELRNGSSYFNAALVAYVVGLGLAMVAVQWMRMGQPALLYSSFYFVFTVTVRCSFCIYYA